MHVLFALVIYGYGHFGSPVAVRIGVYEKPSQCKTQGNAFIEAERKWYFKCIPVNG